jgi:hypothetical protein
MPVSPFPFLVCFWHWHEQLICVEVASSVCLVQCLYVQGLCVYSTHSVRYVSLQVVQAMAAPLFPPDLAWHRRDS